MPRGFIQMLAPVAALAASAMAVPACAADTSFATLTGLGNSFVATNPGTAGGSLTLTDTSLVNFNYLATSTSPAVSGIPANLVFTASSANANFNASAAALGIADQTAFSGSFTVTSIQPITIGSSSYAAGSNLLSATFTNATLLGVVGQRNAGLTADTLTGTLIYTSDFLTFAQPLSGDYSFSLGAINPSLATGTINGLPAYLEPFTSTPTGSFASEPAPLSTAVPEADTWAMMLVGLGAIGLSLRGKARRSPRGA